MLSAMLFVSQCNLTDGVPLFHLGYMETITPSKLTQNKQQCLFLCYQFMNWSFVSFNHDRNKWYVNNNTERSILTM